MVPDLVEDEAGRAEAVARVDRAIDALNLVIADIRSYILRLRPALAGPEDPVEALARLGEELGMHAVVDLDVDLEGGADLLRALPPDRRSDVLFIAREALSNVARHAGASRTVARPRPRRRRPRAGDRGQRAGLRPRRARRAPTSAGTTRASPTCAPAPWRMGGTPRAVDAARDSRSRHSYHRPRPTSPENPAVTEPPLVHPLRLLVVDDHEVVRQGLVALLDRREGFQVVAEAGTAAEAIEQARRFQPDIVVMDVRLPDGSGIEAVPRDPRRAARRPAS